MNPKNLFENSVFYSDLTQRRGGAELRESCLRKK